MVGKTTKKSAKTVSKAKQFWTAVGIIFSPLIIGGISSALTMNAMTTFKNLNQPPFAPPAWLFPVAWTILYILMGVAAYLIFKTPAHTKSAKKYKKAELIIFAIQLAFNFFWTILFFNVRAYYFSFAWLLVMWALIVALLVMTCKNHKAAFWLLVPYFLWTTFAAVLNISIAILN